MLFVYGPLNLFLFLAVNPQSHWTARCIIFGKAHGEQKHFADDMGWRDHTKLAGENGFPRASQLPWWQAEPSGSEPGACYVAEGNVFTNYEPLPVKP